MGDDVALLERFRSCLRDAEPLHAKHEYVNDLGVTIPDGTACKVTQIKISNLDAQKDPNPRMELAVRYAGKGGMLKICTMTLREAARCFEVDTTKANMDQMAQAINSMGLDDRACKVIRDNAISWASMVERLVWKRLNLDLAKVADAMVRQAEKDCPGIEEILGYERKEYEAMVLRVENQIRGIPPFRDGCICVMTKAGEVESSHCEACRKARTP